MTSIHHLPQELLQGIVRATLDATGVKPTEEGSTHTIKAFSSTNRVLRAIAVPHLWRNAHISVAFDNLPQCMEGIESFTQPSHPVRQHARTLHLVIDSQTLSLSSVVLALLDTQLAAAITGMTGLQSVRMQLHTKYQFPETMKAILGLPALDSLNASSRGCLKLPGVRAEKLTTLLVHNDTGTCQLDLFCFPLLKELSLSMEDIQSWEELDFPPYLWSTLQSLSLRGFTLNPDIPLFRLAESLHAYQGTNTLKSISYHLAQDEQDTTYAWQMFSQHTQTLELFAFSRAAGWQWPDPFEAYVNAFSELKDLKVLTLNHNETSTVTPLPLTLPPGSLPLDLSLNAPTAPTSMAGGSVDNPAAVVATDDAVEEEHEEEAIVYGPMGAYYCPSVRAEDLEIQSNTARALFKGIPSLQQIKFEPGLTEQTDSEAFAYSISETLYARPE